MCYPVVDYIFGRVIRVDLPRGQAPMAGANLIYVYREFSKVPEARDAALSKERLLIPPSFINRIPWSRGFFQTVESRPLRAGDVFERHCFDATMFGKVSFVDLDGQIVEEPFEPCGTWGLHSYRSLDDEISNALQIPRISD
jgi:hypothetical protein